VTRSLGFHPEAENELNAAADYYARQLPGLDRRFIAAVEQALAQIVAFPEASAPVHTRTRRKVLSGYPYTLMYSLTAAEIRVLAVVHHARRPFYWRGRE
jgi:plasmid stabilization system protein ParE